ncbi:hypothetical protein CHS0354_032597 [Potamilus streckersoni]|uniref:VWFA domain-containing protein n=1 Tax=Potamilus streckersoni TaxID=2493646 RepID=A0AAE0T8C8_9BIVA|nr:hypothetical protein CHS0354_032597 [Potamilus streckersoni]
MAKMGSSSVLQFLIIFLLGITSSGFLLTTFLTANPTTDQMHATPASKNTSGGCIAKIADVMFVLDSSSSVGATNFIKMKLFVKQIIRFFNVDFNYTRIGVMTFSNEPKIWFGLEAYGTEKEIFKAIDNITYLEGGTYTEHALETLRLEGFAHERAGDMAPNIAIVITDGFSHYPEATQIQAEGLRRNGVTLFAVGIGNSTDKTELEGIASTNDVGQKLAYHVDTFDGLRSLESVVAYDTCDVKLNETWLINTTMETVPMTDATVSCRDLIPNCDGYGRDVCSDYEPWARKNCPYFCRMCAGVTYTVPPCQDKVKCSEYGTYVCTKLSMFMWAKENCPVYCGMCSNTTMPPAAFTTTPTTATTTFGCHDVGICKDGSCNVVDYAKDNCQKSCGYCNASFSWF